jgi:TonB family protein
MKTTLAIALLAFALSFCNLLGRRSNTNTNGNSRSSGEIAESSPASSPGENPGREIESPPTLTQSAPRTAAPPSSLPAANHNAAVSKPPPPTPYVHREKPATISGGVLNGKAISKPQPAYPAMAKAVKASGTVTVQITIDESGNVITARAVSGHPLLQPSAVAAARQAKFSPTKLNGQPVKVTGVITYNFVLQ